MSLKLKTISALKWNTFLSSSQVIINILKLSFLARFINPEDFGLMAIITIVLGFSELFMDFGLSASVLQNDELTKKDLSSIFWMNIIFGFFIFLFIQLISGTISDFYNEPRLSFYIKLTSFGIIFSSLGKNSKTILQKNFKFDILSKVELISNITSLCVSIFLAFLGYGVIALIIGYLINIIVSNITFIFLDYKNIGTYRYFSFNSIKNTFNLGFFQTTGQFFNYFSKDFDTLLIGYFFNSTTLGNYSLAKQLALRPLQFIIPIISKVGLSLFPKIKNQDGKLKTLFSELTNFNSVVFSILYGLLIIWSHEAIKFIYGVTFIGINQILIILFVISYFRSLGSFVGVLSLTKGKTIYDLYWNLILFVLTPIILYVGKYFGSIFFMLNLFLLFQILLIFVWWFIYFKKLISVQFLEFINLIFKSTTIILLLYLINYNFDVSIFQKVFLTLLLVSVQTFPVIKKYSSLIKIYDF